jgi:hypothetical protein
MEIIMTTTLADFFDKPMTTDQLACSHEEEAARTVAKKKTYPPETDIVLWLTRNAPTSFDELIDIRYSLYHRCSRAGYIVKRWNDEELKLTGRSGTLHIVSNMARRFLLSKLRELAKDKGWRGALPRMRRGRTAQ